MTDKENNDDDSHKWEAITIIAIAVCVAAVLIVRSITG